MSNPFRDPARDTRATTAGEAAVPAAKIFVHFARANPLSIKELR